MTQLIPEQWHLADSLVGNLATQSLVPCDVPAEPAKSPTPPAPAAVKSAAGTVGREKMSARKKAIQPMHTE